jgi:hypothetical protein
MSRRVGACAFVVVVALLGTAPPALGSLSFGTGVVGGEPERVVDRGPGAPFQCPDPNDPDNPFYIDGPDQPARAVRDRFGRLHLVGALDKRELLGTTFDNLVQNCSKLLEDGKDTDPSKFDYIEFLNSPYYIGPGDTNSGWPSGTIAALVHEEYHGESIQPTPAACQGGPSPQGCHRKSVTMARSANDGLSFQDIATPPGHLVASVPYQLNPNFNGGGYVGPTNIIRVDDPPNDPWYYAMFYAQAYMAQTGGTCVMRTKVLQPTAWLAYGDGNGDGDLGFEVQFRNPYLPGSFEPTQHVCTPLRIGGTASDDPPRPHLSIIARSLTYNDFLHKFVVVGVASASGNIVYSESTDLVTDWSARKVIINNPTFGCGGYREVEYPSLIDEGDTTSNYEVTDQRAQLYYVSLNNICEDQRNRDLWKVPITFAPERSASGAAACFPNGFDQHKLSGPGGSSGMSVNGADSYGGVAGSYSTRVSLPSSPPTNGQFAQGVVSKETPPTGAGGSCVQDPARANLEVDRGDEIWYSAAVKFTQGFWGTGEPEAPVTLLRLDDNGSNAAGAVVFGTDRRIHFVTGPGIYTTELAYDSSDNPGVPAPNDSCWHLLEVHQKLGVEGKSLNDLYLDGQPISNLVPRAQNWHGAVNNRLKAGISVPTAITHTIRVGVDSVRFNYSGPSTYSPVC